MINLILILMSISLISIFLLVGVNTLSTDKITTNNYEKRVNIAFSAIENQIYNYRKVYNKYPEVSKWESELYPDFGIKPEIDFGTWHLINENSDYKICLEVVENSFNDNLLTEIVNGSNAYEKNNNNCNHLEGISLIKKV